MDDIISILSTKNVSADWLMQRVITMGTSSEAIDLFMRCITWKNNKIDVDTVNKRANNVLNYFLDTNIISLFIVLTKCGVKPQNMMNYMFEILKNNWETSVEKFIRSTRENNTSVVLNGYRNEPIIYDGTEQPSLSLPIFLTAGATPNIENVAKDKNEALYPKEWPQLKDYRKTLMEQLRKIVKFSSSWTKPTNADELITNFGDFLENTMHISSRSVVYSEIKNLFIDIIENCATLVDYQLNGKGLDPLFLKYDTNVTVEESTDSVVNLNGKIFKYLREGYLDRWYGWAAQWWLKDKHSKWFANLHRMSRTEEHDYIKRSAEIVLVDENSCGASRFCMYGLTVLNYPALKYIRVFRNQDPWWTPPEMIHGGISTVTEVKIENRCKKEKIHEHLNVLKKYIKRLNGKVIFYTTSADYLGYCVINNIPLYIETIHGSSIGVESLREQILYQTNIVGALTKYVEEETRILTYVALMMISLSHGIPLYVAFGWNIVLKQWYRIVKENTIPGSRPPTANKTCSWLARRVDNGILLNQPLLSVLFTRLLNNAFTPDRKVVKGDGSNGYLKYLKKHYKEMKEENRVGSGMVKPVDVMDIWNPFTKRFGSKSQLESSTENLENLKKYEESRNIKQYKRDLREWNKENNKNIEKEKRKWRLANEDRYYKEINKAKEKINALKSRNFNTEIKKEEEKLKEIKNQLDVVDDKLKALKDRVTDNTTSLLGTLSGLLTSSSETYSELEQEALTLNNEKSSIRDRILELKKDSKEADKQINDETAIKMKLKNELKDAKGFDIPEDIDGRPDINDSKYDNKAEDIPSWKDGDVYAPFISKDVIETFTEKEIKDLNLESREWMYAQRLRFISEYYAPESIEKLIESFRIRFRDWSGVSNITINI